MRTSLDDLAATLDPLTCVAAFPAIFCNIFNLLVTALLAVSGIHRFAVCLPRGHGKTIVMKMMLYWAIVFSPKRFIVVVCKTEELAENLIKDVWDFLHTTNSIAIFGAPTEVETDRNDKKVFHFRGKNIVLMGIGSESSVRGLNIMNRRPDLFLCDDMQSKENAESTTQAVQLQKWFIGTLLKAGAPEGYTVVYIGNMYPDMRIPGDVERYTCILRNLQLNRLWTTWVVGAILQDGTALWEAVRSLVSLYEELEMDMSIGEESTFYAEVLNDPTASNSLIWDASKIKEPHSLKYEGEPPIGRFIILDPSLGKKKSDAQIALLVEFWDERPEVVDFKIFQMSAPDTVHGLILWMLDVNCRVLIAESVAYQATIIQWFDFYCNLVGASGLIALPIHPKGRSKNSRILSAFKAVMAGRISLAMRVRNYLYLQAKQFKPTRTDNTDDGWDCVAYVDDVVITYPDEILIPEDVITLQAGVDGVWDKIPDSEKYGIDFSDRGIEF
ncbi:hypothetical protein P5_0022 [Aeromonas phage P5]|nr:hypothetical protein P5_0022 [Aeromonas phage P5]